jgi:uncharacterized protein YdhG (YjbR/CyaY superfamily)
MPNTPSPVDAYIAGFDPDVQAILRKIRTTIRKAVPKAEEVISYRIPAFRLNGVFLYYAAFKKHIGLYPPVKGDEALVKAVARYAGPKNNLQFPLDEPIPYALIGRIAKLQARRDQERAAVKKTRSSR